MKSIGFYTILMLVLFLSTSAIVDEKECDVRSLKNQLIQELKPDYKYDSSNATRFILESKKQGTEIVVSLFSTEKYRLLFNTAALPVDINIKIYDKKIGSRNRKLLYSIENEKIKGKTVFMYEPETPKTMYIDYILPGVEETELTGCVVFLLGYKIG
jgi:hypothetical protein